MKRIVYIKKLQIYLRKLEKKKIKTDELHQETIKG